MLSCQDSRRRAEEELWHAREQEQAAADPWLREVWAAAAEAAANEAQAAAMAAARAAAQVEETPHDDDEDSGAENRHTDPPNLTHEVAYI